MKDSFGRVIDYARISVTKTCNMRCEYCMPPNKRFLPLSDPEAIARFVIRFPSSNQLD